MKLMAILNVTPDSFSDGGRWADPDLAIKHGRQLVERGADIIDVGGESTRPGAKPLDPLEEWGRIGKVIAVLASEGVAVSVDTYHADTVRRAAAAGASIINDVTGGRVDPDMFAAVAESGLDYILQHSRGPAQTTNIHAVYDDVLAEVNAELSERLDAARAAGIADERIILDPGLGFSKVGKHDWDVLAGFADLVAEDPDRRWLLGASRKRFLGDVTPGSSAEDRDIATHAVTAWAAMNGVWAVRVHDAIGARTVIDTVDRITRRR